MPETNIFNISQLSDIANFKEYDLFLMSDISRNGPEANKLYLVIEEAQVKYRTNLTPGSNSVELEGDISQENGELYQAIQANNLAGLSEPCKKELFKIILQRGHAHFEQALKDILGDPRAYGTLGEIKAQGLDIVERHIADFTNNPEHISALLLYLDSFDREAQQKLTSVGYNTALYSRAIKLLKVAKKNFLLNYYKPMVILYDYIDFLVQQKIAEDKPVFKPVMLGDRSINMPIFPRGVFPTVALIKRPFVEFSDYTQASHRDYLCTVVTNNKVVKDFLIADNYDAYPFGFRISSIQAFLNGQNEMIAELTQAGKMTEEKNDLLNYIDVRSILADPFFPPLGSSNIGRMGKLEAAGQLYYAISGRGEAGVNDLVRTIPALRGGKLGRIASRVITRINAEADDLLKATQSDFENEVCNIEKLSTYMKNCSEKYRGSFLQKILQSKNVAQSPMIFRDNTEDLVEFLTKDSAQFLIIALNNDNLLKCIVKNQYDLRALYFGMESKYKYKTYFFNKILNNAEIMKNLVKDFKSLEQITYTFEEEKPTIFLDILYHKEILEKIHQEISNDVNSQRSFFLYFDIHEALCDLLGIESEDSYEKKLHSLGIYNSKREIIQTARILHQARHPISGCASSFMGKLPDDVLIKISAYLGNPLYHEIDTAQIANQNFNRPKI